MLKKITKLSPFIYIAIITLLIFRQFFLNGLHPFPGNYMLAWYEPWKSEHMVNGTITLPHKAVLDDTFRQLLPFRVLAAEAFKQYTLPLWNPYNGAGMPLLATMHPGFFNPFNVVFLFLPKHLAWSWHIILQIPLLAVGIYLYTKSLQFNTKTIFFLIASFVFSGFVIVRLLFGEYIYVISCLSFLLYCIEQTSNTPKSRVMLAIPFIVLFMFVSGQPQMILYVLIFSSAYAIYRYRQKQQMILILLFFLLLCVGIGLASFQLFPTAELYQQAGITPDSSDFIFKKFLLPIHHLISIVIPNYFGNQGTYNYWGYADFVETIATIGTIPVLFSLLSTNNKKNTPIKFFIVAICLTILSTVEWFGSRLLFSLPLPIIATGIPSRIFVLTVFSIVILSGYGFESWQRSASLSRRMFYKIFGFVSLILIIVSITAILYITKQSCPATTEIPCWTVALRNSVIEFIVLSITVGIVLFFYKVKQGVKPYLATSIIILTICAGVYNSQKFLPFSPQKTFSPQSDLVDALKKHANNERVFGFGEANIKTDFASAYYFYDPNYYDPLYNKRYGELVGFANIGKYHTILPRSDVEISNDTQLPDDKNARRERLLSLLGVKYFIFKTNSLPDSFDNSGMLWTNDTWSIGMNSAAFPRVWLYYDYEKITDNHTLLEKLYSKNFDYENVLLLEQEPKKIGIKGSGKTEIVTYKPNSITMSAQTDQPALLFLSDNYYPGWKAFIDGKETSVLRANYTFRAIELPAGKHEVLFSFEPSSLRIGLYVSLFFTFLYAFLFRFWPKIRGYEKK